MAEYDYINGGGPPPPPPPPPPLQNPSAAQRPLLSHVISEKLTDSNYLVWRQQVEPVIKSQRLHRFLVAPQIPLRFRNDEDCLAGRETEEYLAWEEQDQNLLSWLQSTLSPSLLNRVIGCKHAFEAWERIHKHFQSHTRAKSRQLRTEMHALRLQDRTISEYMLRIKSFADSLAAIGDPISASERLDVILEGLPQDYESTVSLINSRFDPLDVEEIESLLLSHEARLQKYRREVLDATAHLTQVNLTSNTESKPQVVMEKSQADDYSSEDYDQGSGSRGRGRARSDYDQGSGSRGRGRGRSNIQCQVCLKYGPDASICYHRFDQQFMPHQEDGIPGELHRTIGVEVEVPGLHIQLLLVLIPHLVPFHLLLRTLILVNTFLDLLPCLYQVPLATSMLLQDHHSLRHTCLKPT